MRDTAYIVVSPYGIERMTKRPPALAREELGVKVTITVPDGCFAKPFVAVGVDVPEDRVIHPTADVTVDEVPAEEGDA